MDSDNEKQKLKKFLGKPGKSKRNRDDNSKIGSPLTKKKKTVFIARLCEFKQVHTRDLPFKIRVNLYPDKGL